MPYTEQDLSDLNQQFKDKNVNDVIEWALSRKQRVVATTHFGPNEAVLLHHLSQVAPDLNIICIDHGYNTDDTYQVTQKLIERLQLNVSFFTPRVTRQRREVVFGGVPDMSEVEAHEVFVEEVKIEPFARAFDQHKPDIWFTSLRREQTEHRARLDIFSNDGRFGVLKVSPLFYWSDADMEKYLAENDLPNVKDYFDPTKVLEHRECGLHLG